MLRKVPRTKRKFCLWTKMECHLMPTLTFMTHFERSKKTKKKKNPQKQLLPQVNNIIESYTWQSTIRDSTGEIRDRTLWWNKLPSGPELRYIWNIQESLRSLAFDREDDCFQR